MTDVLLSEALLDPRDLNRGNATAEVACRLAEQESAADSGRQEGRKPGNWEVQPCWVDRKVFLFPSVETPEVGKVRDAMPRYGDTGGSGSTVPELQDFG
jgi:hypothetical protein